jgi:hypothetical protein
MRRIVVSSWKRAAGVAATALAVCLAGAPRLAAADAAASAGKAALERLKALAGDWDGTADGLDQPLKIQYRVTSGGSAVIETLFAGSPHEMVTVYHLDGDDLALTHYCASGNQPRMKLERGAGAAGELRFAFDGGTGFEPAKDTHMHSARIAWLPDGRLEAEWSYWKMGKAAGAHRFVAKRAAAR